VREVISLEADGGEMSREKLLVQRLALAVLKRHGHKRRAPRAVRVAAKG